MFEDFNSALDGGNYTSVLAMMLNSEFYPPEADFIAMERQSAEELGHLVQRDIVKVTWTKDPRDAASPGIYVAVDIAAKYENADRFCGYLILFQPDERQPFKIMRRESIVLVNAAAAKASKEVVDRQWAMLSRLCPNYKPPVEL